MKSPKELWTVAQHLGDLVDEVVFVGGMVRDLLITDPAAGPSRPTDDVDCIIDVNRGQYMLLTEKLRSRGFREDTDDDAPLCRWRVEGISVDVMPVNPEVLGFSNVWYPSGLQHAVEVAGRDGTIQIVNAPHFCATKIEAFLGRGNGDFYHHDIEDLVAILIDRETIVQEIASAPAEVRQFVTERIVELLADDRFVESLPGHLPPDEASQARLRLLKDRLRQITGFAASGTKTRKAASMGQQTRLAPSMASLPTRNPDGYFASLPRHVELRSRALRAASYDPTSRVLTLDFRGDRTYSYANVPITIYAGLLNASSHGRYYHQWIRGRFEADRLR